MPRPKGYKVTEETKKKISDANKGHRGVVHTEEFKQRLSKIHRERPRPPRSDETKQKLREANLGTHHPMPEMVHHHAKYEEIHGVDVVVELSYGDHLRLHRRLRKEGKCNIPPKELHEISAAARQRRKSTSEPTV